MEEEKRKVQLIIIQEEERKKAREEFEKLQKEEQVRSETMKNTLMQK
jgi:hypothetical protein